MRWGAVLIVGLSACTEGPEAFSSRGVPEPDGEPALTIEPVAVVDGVAYARAGATLTLTLPVRAIEGLDAQASNVSLTGVELESAGDGLTWTRTLDGSEGDGLKTLDARIADNLGQISRFQDPDIAVTLDFTPPRADCVLAPATANASSNVSFAVLPSEPLAALPTVAAADPDIVLDDPQPEGGGTRWTVSFPDGVDFDPYVLTATATDRAGNPQDGDSLCDPAARTGRRIGQGPQRDGDLQFAATPAVDHDGVPLVREGADLTVSIPLAGTGPIEDRLDLDASVVTLSGIPLDHLGGTTWGRTLTGAEGDGLKDLDARLFDPVGNSLRVQQPGVVRFDFTAPTAACALTPRVANRTGAITLRVFPTEPLAAGSVAVDGVAPLVPGTPAVEGDAIAIALAQPATPTDVPAYTAIVRATDRAGNPQAGDSLCAEVERQGSLKGVGPVVLPDPTLTVSPAVADPAGLPRARAGAALTLTLTTAEPLDPGRSRVALTGIALASDDGVTWTGVVAPTDGDGARTLDATLVDPAGNVATLVRADIGLVVDQLPPAIASASAQRAPFLPGASAPGGGLDVTDVDPLTGEPVAVTLSIVATEALQGVPTLDSAALGWVARPADAWDDRSARWSLGGVAAMPTGVVDLAATLVDRVGNAASGLPVPVTVRVDRDPPPAIDGSPAGGVSLARAPWGAASTGGVPRTLVQGADGTVAPGALVIVRDRVDRLLGSATATPTGAFGPIALPADASEVRIVQVDAAGNPSPAADVQQIRWVASLGGKVVGSAFENPHDLTGLRTLRPGALDPGAPERVPPGSADLTRTVLADGSGWETVSGSRWVSRTPADAAPAGRNDAALAWDPARGVLLMFGGSGASGPLDDTWEHDGVAWRRRVPRTAPDARQDAQLAWDPASGRMLLFGGLGGSGRLADTWAWDGTTWTRLTTAHAPAPRDGAAIATDPVRGRLVLFGGFTTASTTPWFDDTWTWDGQQWVHEATAVRPPGRSSHALAWDPVHEEIVLFGGANVDGNLGDTWTWDGATWTARTPPTSPSPRFGHRLAWDAVRGEVVLFGGSDGIDRDDTWTWNGSTWTERASATRPAPRIWSALAHDPVRGDLVLFGGLRGDTFVSDDETWRWSGTTWTRARTPVPLPARYGHGLAADPSATGIVAFGGKAGFDQDLGDVWRWDGVRWTAVSTPSGPPAREQMVFVADPIARNIVMFGGLEGEEGSLFGGPTILNDPWSWRSGRWLAVDPPARPSARYDTAAAHDPVRGQVVVFGGRFNADDLSALTLVWDGTTWAIAPVDASPSARRGAAFGWDADREELVLFGGTTNVGAGGGELDDTWTWDGTAWTRLDPPARPSPRLGATLTWDTARRRLVLFGGGSVAEGVRDDTWTWDGATWTPEATSTRPPARVLHGAAVDPTTAAITVVGGLRGGLDLDPDTWTWDGGVADRPAQRLDVRFGAAQAPADVTPTAVTVRWHAGGAGDGPDGAALLAWTGADWRSVAQHDATPDAADTLCWQLQATPASPPDGCTATVDAAWLARLVAPSAPPIAFAVQSRAPRGSASAPAAVFTDAVEVEVAYTVQAARSVPWADSLEACDGWRLAGDWACDRPTAGPAATEGARVLATNPRGAYANDRTFDTNTAISPPLRVPPTGATLSFDLWWDIEEAPYDGAQLAISGNGGPWQTAPTSIPYTGPVDGRPAWSDNASAAGWRRVDVDLGPWAGQRIQLRFALASDDSVTRPGLAIDRLRVE